MWDLFFYVCEKYKTLSGKIDFNIYFQPVTTCKKADHE